MCGPLLASLRVDATLGPVKEQAFSQFAKTCAGYKRSCAVSNITFVGDQFNRNQTKLMGYSVRVAEWRYTAWFAFDARALHADTTQVVGRELYDHRADTGMWLDFPGEEVNLAPNSTFKTVVQQLHSLILKYIVRQI